MSETLFDLNHERLLDTMKTLINTPSPSGYYDRIIKLLKKYFDELEIEITVNEKNTVFAYVKGSDSKKTVGISAHIDTLGLSVNGITENGCILTRAIGGVNYNSLEGESVVVHTRNNMEYTGLIVCKSHSVHVFDDARAIERNEDSMYVLLDENVKTKEDVEALGICSGDYIFIDPRFEVTPKGFIKSRFIDNKASVAIIIETLRCMKERNLVPLYDTIFVFSIMEEMANSSSNIPEKISEFVAMDIGLIGKDQTGDEYSVTICKKDAYTIYSRELTKRLIFLAKENDIKFKEDVYDIYYSDASASWKCRNNIQIACFGMGVFSTHAMERTHLDSINESAKLLAAYLAPQG